jgi:uncharacterized protein (TIGR02145 family)
MIDFHKSLAFFIITIGLTLLYDPVNAQKQPGIVKDKDGNIYTIKTFPGSKIWMTENLKINIPGSYCYDGKTENCDRYGRLYTWTSAIEGCMALGKDWHLPTNEEWQQMASSFGGVRDNSKDSGRTAYSALMVGGRSQFDALFGGSRDPDSVYRRLEAHGFYWTATETSAGTAWFYNFGKNGKMLNRHEDGEKQRAASVRCVRDVKR